MDNYQRKMLEIEIEVHRARIAQLIETLREMEENLAQVVDAPEELMTPGRSPAPRAQGPPRRLRSGQRAPEVAQGGLAGTICTVTGFGAGACAAGGKRCDSIV